MNFVYMGMMQYIWEQTEEISRPGEEKKKVKNSCQIVVVKLHCFSWLIPENFDKFFHNKRFCKTNATQNYVKTLFLKL